MGFVKNSTVSNFQIYDLQAELAFYLAPFTTTPLSDSPMSGQIIPDIVVRFLNPVIEKFRRLLGSHPCLLFSALMQTIKVLVIL